MNTMKRWVINTVIAAILLAWTLWPIVCVLIAGCLANWAGASLDEGSVHPTVIHGIDYGETAYMLFVLGWFGMITLPTGGILLLLHVVIATTEWLISRARRRRALPPQG